MAGYQDIFLNQGETFNTVITLDDQNAEPYNLYNFEVSSRAKKSYYSNTIVLNFDASIIDANNGTIQLSANSAATANINPGRFVYDVVIKDNASGVVTRVLEGQIIVSPGVTLNLSQ